MVEFAFGPHLAHSTLGFERIFNDLDKVLNDRQQQSTFPPHNILKVDRDHYVVELAVAGFGKDEIDNLQLAKFIGKTQNKELNYEMVDFHSQRPGHDLRYALDGSKMANMGWTPQSAYERLEKTIKWTLENDSWLSI